MHAILVTIQELMCDHRWSMVLKPPSRRLLFCIRIVKKVGDNGQAIIPSHKSSVIILSFGTGPKDTFKFLFLRFLSFPNRAYGLRIKTFSTLVPSLVCSLNQ